MTLLPRDRAVLMPVGLGREPPAPLPEPTRSESSGRPLDFVKSLKFGNWKKEHKVAAGTAAAITVVALLGYLQVPMLLFDFMTVSFISLVNGLPIVHTKPINIVK
uniref:SFRICE_020532 n=1 Tax=Spodoptera frugiperda TaxID=7108 RepID=A0A2H1VNN7_SPOFR